MSLVLTARNSNGSSHYNSLFPQCSRQQPKLQIKLRSSLPSQCLGQPPSERSWAAGHDQRGGEPPGCWRPWGSESQTSSSSSMQGRAPGGSDLMTAQSFDNINLAQQKLIDTIFHLHILLSQQLAMLVSSNESSCSPGAVRVCMALLSPAGVPGSHCRLAVGEWIARSTEGVREWLTTAPRVGMRGCRTHSAHLLISRYSNGLGKSWVLSLVHLFIIPVRQKSHHSGRAPGTSPRRTGWGARLLTEVFDVGWLRLRVRKGTSSKQAGTQEEQDCYRGQSKHGKPSRQQGEVQREDPQV